MINNIRRKFKYNFVNSTSLFSKVNSKFLLPKRKENKKIIEFINVNIQDIINFLYKRERIMFIYNVNDGLFYFGNLAYTQNQLLIKANKIRKSLNLPLFILNS